jgi:SAM-dependent methyltransferase
VHSNDDQAPPLWGAAPQAWTEIEEPQALPLYRAVLESLRISDETCFLDVGCGAGLAAKLATERGAAVTGLDASPQMLEIARQRVPDAEFLVGTMDQMPFKDAHFDAVVGFNSFQFAGSASHAIAEAGRVAKPGRPIGIAVWGPPSRCDIYGILEAQAELLPAQRRDGSPQAFALSEAGALKDAVERAGLQPGNCLEIACRAVYPSLETAIRGLTSGRSGATAVAAAGESATREAIGRALAPFEHGGRVELENVCHFLIATA